MILLDFNLGPLGHVKEMTPFWLMLAVSGAILACTVLRQGAANLEWNLGHGYILLWRQLHKAEESILMAMPVEQLLAEATFDEERLIGSTIKNADALLFRLQQARAVLIKTANLNEVWSQPVPTRALGPGLQGSPNPDDALVARQWICEVRSAINDFRDESWGGLVRARNNLQASIFMTTLFGVMIAVLVVVVAASEEGAVTPSQVVAATALYFTGSIIGLINQLRLDRDSDSAVEDYGLSWARRINTPLLCGLTGLAAAILIPMLSALTSVGTGSAEAQVPTLHQLLDLSAYPKAIPIAAIFGLTPTALLSRLQSESEKYKTAITKSTASSDGSS